MSHKIRVGVIGTSDYADFMYLSFLKDYPRAELAAICGQNRERTEKRAAQYGIPQVYTDYRQMIQAGNLDGVIVAAPDDLHYEMTMLALEAGLHVICDKPLAISAQQALEMYEAAMKAGVKHQVTFTYRWIPVFQYLRDLIAEGFLGRCYHAEFRYLAGGGRQKNETNDWRYDQKRTNGNLADMGSHMIDMARWLLGEITRVSALLGVFVEVPTMDGDAVTPSNDTAFLLTEFANGAHGTILATRVAYLPNRGMQQEIRLYGQNGSLELNVNYFGVDEGVSFQGARLQDKQFQPLEIPASYGSFKAPFDWFNILARQSVGCRAWVDAILDDRPVTPSFYDGLKAQQVIEAALVSHQSGKWVAIS